VSPLPTSEPPASTTTPSLATVLDKLTRERLLDLGRVSGIALRAEGSNKRDTTRVLAAALGDQRLPEILRELGREELRAVCRAHGLGLAGPRVELSARILSSRP